jgi:phasin family protein
LLQRNIALALIASLDYIAAQQSAGGKMASQGPKEPKPVKATTPRAPRARVTKPLSAIEVAPEPTPVTLSPIADLPEPAALLQPTPAVAPEPAEKPAEPAPHTEIQPNEATAPAQPAPAPIEEPVMTDTTINTATAAADTAADKSKAMFNDMNERTRTAMERGSKAVEELTELSKGHMEAVVESSKIAAKGFESMGQDAADYGRRSFEQATAMMKSLAGAKTPTEFFKLQNDYVRSAFDALVAETSKNTEAMLKLAGDVAQPISNRVAVTVEKAKIAA